MVPCLSPDRAGPYADGVLRKAGRWFNPTTLMLAGLCFVLPFVSVGCDTPGGYAGTSPGGSTTYNGVALAVGGQPDVTEGHERPVPPGEDDRLPPQPAAAVVLLLIVAATAFAIRVAEPRPRRAYVGGLAAAGATGLLVNQALVQAELTLRVSDHLTRLAAAGQKLDPTKSARDYVHTGQGFGLCLLLLLVVIVVNAVGWWRARPRPALVSDST
jgi:hypothetical protein